MSYLPHNTKNGLSCNGLPHNSQYKSCDELFNGVRSTSSYTQQRTHNLGFRSPPLVASDAPGCAPTTIALQSDTHKQDSSTGKKTAVYDRYAELYQECCSRGVPPAYESITTAERCASDASPCDDSFNDDKLFDKDEECCTSDNQDTQPSTLKSLTHPLVHSSHSRIDSSLVPRPLHVTDCTTQLGGDRYQANQNVLPPSSNVECTVESIGNASCRFIRMSLYQIPLASRVLETCGIPIVCAIQPFPCLGEYETPVPLINLNQETFNDSGLRFAEEEEEEDDDEDDTCHEGPLRCTRCHSYASPYTEFMNDTTIALCCFCGHHFRIPRHYQLALANLSNVSRYVLGEKKSERPELVYGVVDYMASHKYYASCTPPLIKKPSSRITQQLDSMPSPPGYCFVIDTSTSALQCGFTAATVGAIQYALDTLPFPDTIYVSFITFNKEVIFHEFPVPSQHGPQHVQALVVTDIEEPFVPVFPSHSFVHVVRYKAQIEAFLESLKNMSITKGVTERPSTSQSCGNAALYAAVSMFELSKRSGSISIFYAAHPDIGMGSLDKMKKTEKRPQPKKTYPFSLPPCPFYTELWNKALKAGVSVDVFAASLSRRPMHFSRLCSIARQTGGYCCCYNDFSVKRAYTQLCYDIAQLFQCSKDRILTAASISSPTSPTLQSSDQSVLRLPRIDSLGSLIFTLKYDGNTLPSSRYAFIQFACLHTTIDGQVRIRVATLSLPTTTTLSTVFRYADIETLVAYYARLVVDLLCNHSQRNWKEHLANALTTMLSSYRLHCAASSTSGQLILPDALKTLPVYILTLLKHPALNKTVDLVTDDTELDLFRLTHTPLHQLLNWLYPRLYVLHRSFTCVKQEDLASFGTSTGVGNRVYPPPVLPLTGTQVTTDGIYLLDTAFHLTLYIGEHVDPAVLHKLFREFLTTDSFDVVNVEHLKGDLGERISRFIHQIKQEKSRLFPYQPLRIITAKSPQEHTFYQSLVEDRQRLEPGCLDFLCQLHREIQLNLNDL